MKEKIAIGTKVDREKQAERVIECQTCASLQAKQGWVGGQRHSQVAQH